MICCRTLGLYKDEVNEGGIVELGALACDLNQDRTRKCIEEDAKH